MLKAAFIGNDNFFSRFICEWLSERTDLALVLWTNKLAWAGTWESGRHRRVAGRFLARARRYGPFRAADEALYYFLYRRFLQAGEIAKLERLIQARRTPVRKPLSEIEQVVVEDIRSPELYRKLDSSGLDVLLSVCVDVFLPDELIRIPRHGAFLWHEGITPEYRGVYSPFWALARRDYERLGYTLLKMNGKWDAGDIYVQGRVQDVDPSRDWHSYIGHKAVLDSLPHVERFLEDLGRGTHKPIVRTGAQDNYYSYPTASALLGIQLHRLMNGRRR